MQLEHKIVVITGASSGLGEAAAKALAKRGAHVALLARNRAALARVAAEIEKEGGMATTFPADLTDAAAVERTARAIVADLGIPDVIVNNAGSGRWLFTDETSAEEAVQAMATPYFSMFYITRAFLPDMLQRGTGHILNVTSPVCFFSWPGASAYGAARWAVRGFTELLRADVGRSGIKVSLVCAGQMDTPYFDNNPGSKERIPSIARLYRTLQPAEVADAIVRAVERGQRDIIMPMLLKQTLFFQRLAPWLIEWLVMKTGHQRPATPHRPHDARHERTTTTSRSANGNKPSRA
jgi:short-subunit dehydrogenase